MKKLILILGITLLLTEICFPQVENKSELFIKLKKMDSLVFDEGFNKCKIAELERLMHKDAEFLHDQSGVQDRAKFFEVFKQGVCSNPNVKPIRKLVEPSLKVYPLKDRGRLYGAIQMGEHKFYIAEPGKELRLTSIAKFTHVWFLESKEWKLKRILSYDHQAPEK